MNQAELNQLLKIYKLTPNFTYGQNFLIDDNVLHQIVECAQVSKTDCVVEVGPGIGNLTRQLCERAGYVVSVEKDPKFNLLLSDLKKQYSENFSYVIADVLNWDVSQALTDRTVPVRLRALVSQNFSSQLPVVPYKVVANIPYYITGKILEKFLTGPCKPSSITVLVQKEVAERVVAQVGELNVLAISVQIFGVPKIFKEVSKHSFFPVPQVDSAILHIELYNTKKFNITNEKKFFKILKACFAGKRKQIHNTLVNNLRLDKNLILTILSELKINPMARPQELSIEEWLELTKILNLKLAKPLNKLSKI